MRRTDARRSSKREGESESESEESRLGECGSIKGREQRQKRDDRMQDGMTRRKAIINRLKGLHLIDGHR